jgi:drug/metabolite transporter (DMT)-like permease
MTAKLINGSIFLLLCLIWGSSFMLMKDGMHALTPYQVASLRILSAGLVLFPFALKAFRNIAPQQRAKVVLSGLLGSFFPAYLFCVAETRIDAALAGILNALTPLFVILVGKAFFQLSVKPIQVVGMVIGFLGLSALVLSGRDISFVYLGYAFLVLLATLLYGINVNMVGRHLQGVAALDIAALAFVCLTIPCGLHLYGSGFFDLPLGEKPYLAAIGASALLGVGGTAIASIFFYVLVKRAGAVFASTVTYGIPFVALAWGLQRGETIGWWQVVSLFIILLGVWLVNKKN